MPPTGLEPTIPASERPHTHATMRLGSVPEAYTLLNLGSIQEIAPGFTDAPVRLKI
jgi:hypothetical protein